MPPRRKSFDDLETTIVAAIADRHPKPDVKYAIARLSVLDRIDRKGSGCSLPAVDDKQG